MLDIACSQFFLYQRVMARPDREGVELAGHYLAAQAVYHSIVTEPEARPAQVEV